MKHLPVLLSFTGMAAIVMLSLSVLTGCSSRPDKPTMEIPTPDKQIYTLKHRLQLTDEQMKMIKPIIESDHAQKSQIVKEFEPGDQRAMRATREELEDLEWETYKKMSKVLTPEQMELYSKLLLEEEKKRQEQRQAKRGGKGGHGGRGGGF